MTKHELFNDLKCPSLGDKIHLITHNDLDGAAPGIMLKSIYGKDNVTVTSVGNNYMSNAIEIAVTDNHLSHDYDFVMVCDISCDEAAAERINALPGLDNFVLLDHHKTANSLNKYPWSVVCSPMPDDSFRRSLVPDNAPSDKVCSSGTSLLYDFLDEKGVLNEAHSANAVFERMQTDYPDKDLYVINCGYSLSFRSLKDDVDVSAIAASLGGGGHKGAAGVPISFDEQVGLMANVMNIPSHAIIIDEPVSSAMPLRTVRKDGVAERHVPDTQKVSADKDVLFSL